MKTFKSLIFLFILSSVIFSCNKDKNDNAHVEYVNSQIYDMMKQVYLWNDYIPYNLDPADYSTPAKFMEALRYKQYDHWSTVLTEEEYNSYFTEGQMIGHGFMVGLDADNNFRIAFVYNNTQAQQEGVRRGWILSKVNNKTVTVDNFSTLFGADKVGVTNNFTFIDNGGQQVTLSLAKEEINLTPVLHSEVINRSGKKIGYIVFQDFIETANQELDTAFTTFKNAGIDELVVDMRYNGGGAVTVAEHLAGWLIGKNEGGQPFIYYEHNAILSKAPYSMDTMYTVPAKADGLDMSRIFFIGTSNTASASELIINGVKPFITTVLAGSPTHGKPVGMYAIPIEDYFTLPVCFKYSNKNHEGNFYNGLTPDLPADDDITKDWGNPEETSLKAILDYIDNGTAKSTKSTGFGPRILESHKPLGQFLRAI
ncbi:MAG TPA: S41 family peptidase [Bacteroidales bacterium]|nr:S41 family peptidase [Bacteroidales bacterium]